MTFFLKYYIIKYNILYVKVQVCYERNEIEASDEVKIQIVRFSMCAGLPDGFD